MPDLNDHPSSPGSGGSQRERGQIIVIMAGAMIALLVMAGLATDAGILFVRKSQLDRAVDAAVLAGITELASDVDAATALTAANTRGQQLLAANDVFTEASTECPDTPDPGFWETYDYCGKSLPGLMPGAIRYHAEVRWQSEVYFMRLLGFDTFPLRAEATAEYIPIVDLYSSQAMETSILQTSTQSIFGPGSCASMGDPYTPTSSPYWGELEGVYTYRISIPSSYEHDRLRVEIFDPDTYNAAPTPTYRTYGLNGVLETATPPDTANACKNNARVEPCLVDRGVDENFWWYERTDENRTPPTCSTPGSYTPDYNTRTEYRLYYYKQLTDGSLQRVDLASYIGESDGAGGNAAEAAATDMRWVSPGAPAGERMPQFTVAQVYAGLYDPSLYGDADYVLSPEEPATTMNAGCATCTANDDFIIHLQNDLPGIYMDPGSGGRDLFLDVIGKSGSSENGFELWAGPPRTADVADYQYTAPADINARQLYLTLKRQAGTPEKLHESENVAIYGRGHLPMNSNANNRVLIPLAYLGAEYSGQLMRVQIWDADAGAEQPIIFFFEGVPPTHWAACFGDGGPDAHKTKSENDCDEPVLLNGLQATEASWVANVHSFGSAGGNNSWAGYVDPVDGTEYPYFEFVVPSESPTGGVGFYGGRLYVSYDGGLHDTYGWKITLESRPFLVQ